MYRVTRNLVATAAATVLLAGVAPGAATAAPQTATGKPGVSVEHGKPAASKDKAKGGKKDKQKIVGERNAALQIVRTRDAQLVKIAKYVTTDTPVTVGDYAAKDTLLANLAADRDALADVVTALRKATTAAEVKALKKGVQSCKASNYEDAADLLLFAADNIEAANEDLTAPGAPEAAAAALDAAALLVQVHAVDSDDLLDEATDLIDASDAYLYGDDTDDTDEDEDETDDSAFRA